MRFQLFWQKIPLLFRAVSFWFHFQLFWKDEVFLCQKIKISYDDFFPVGCSSREAWVPMQSLAATRSRELISWTVSQGDWNFPAHKTWLVVTDGWGGLWGSKWGVSDDPGLVTVHDIAKHLLRIEWKRSEANPSKAGDNEWKWVPPSSFHNDKTLKDEIGHFRFSSNPLVMGLTERMRVCSPLSAKYWVDIERDWGAERENAMTR